MLCLQVNGQTWCTANTDCMEVDPLFDSSITRSLDLEYTVSNPSRVDDWWSVFPAGETDLTQYNPDIFAYICASCSTSTATADVSSLDPGQYQVYLMTTVPFVLLDASPIFVIKDVPSSIPSQRPSQGPSDRPSQEPSQVPSQVPSHLPSDAPSFIPSSSPSQAPSDVPSYVPSDAPSIIPSDAPSKVPSTSPSTFPSTLPSDKPSTLPSISPSHLPSNNPSLSPSMTPSHAPSASPTDVPSQVPSDVPSLVPTTIPSIIPSDAFSNVPSDIPSVTPTYNPSKMPSFLPSRHPTSLPSSSPTHVPSKIPTNVPSPLPTNMPTLVPSKIPTEVPSIAPSEVPSIAPSTVPSINRFIYNYSTSMVLSMSKFVEDVSVLQDISLEYLSSMTNMRVNEVLIDPIIATHNVNNTSSLSEVHVLEYTIRGTTMNEITNDEYYSEVLQYMMSGYESYYHSNSNTTNDTFQLEYWLEDYVMDDIIITSTSISLLDDDIMLRYLQEGYIGLYAGVTNVRTITSYLTTTDTDENILLTATLLIESKSVPYYNHTSIESGIVSYLTQNFTKYRNEVGTDLVWYLQKVSNPIDIVLFAKYDNTLDRDMTTEEWSEVQNITNQWMKDRNEAFLFISDVQLSIHDNTTIDSFEIFLTIMAYSTDTYPLVEEALRTYVQSTIVEYLTRLQGGNVRYFDGVSLLSMIQEDAPSSQPVSYVNVNKDKKISSATLNAVIAAAVRIHMYNNSLLCYRL